MCVTGDKFVIEEILINLNDERDAYIVKTPANMVHMRALHLIQQRISESLQNAVNYVQNKKNSDSELLNVRKHDTIMLAGVRGSGKTTFMLSMLNFINHKVEGAEEYHYNGNIESLHILDPTLIENKTHIFTNIISMIKDKVDEIAKKGNCFKNEENHLSRKYKAWENSFRKLAEGLPSIEGVGSDGFRTDSWLDPEFVMGIGVQRAHASKSLEKVFHEYVRLSLDFIGKQAFILCFDDIDTNFGKGWPVLEVLHKYLTTPQMITILSGDPNLYSILIRQQQWANFSNRFLKMEAEALSDDRQKYKETVAHLEEQYFLKLLKPERRIFLNSLYQKELQLNTIIVQGIQGKSLDKITLREGYNQIFNKFGIFSVGQQEIFYRFLASTPLRTQKQLLYAFDTSSTENGRDLSNSIIDIFWSDLSEKKLDVSNLRNVPHYTVPQVVDYLVRNQILIEGYTLTPLFSDHFTNAAQFALGTLVTERIKKDPTQIFEYWLRVCLTRELGAMLGARSTINMKGPSVDDYVEYCAINTLRTSRYVSRFSTAYIRANLGYLAARKTIDPGVSYDKGTWHGTLPLLGLATKAKKSLPERIDSVLDNAGFFDKVMGYLPLSGSTNHKGEYLPVYSFYNLLGVLGEILLVARNAKEDDASNEVIKTIIKNAQYREYPLPAWALSLSPGDDNSVVNAEDYNGAEVDQNNIDETTEIFAKSITRWARSIEPELMISPSILGKIFTRFFYTTNNMDQDLPKDTRLGYWMHRMTVVFLHSVVLVEATERLNFTKEKSTDGKPKEIKGLMLTNPVNRDDIFINNLKAINANKDEDLLYFSKWLLSCPIWKVYMRDEFDCSKTISDAEKEFFTFISKMDCVLAVDSQPLPKAKKNPYESKDAVTVPKAPQPVNLKLHAYKLNKLLDTIEIKKQRQTKFSVDDDACRVDFMAAWGSDEVNRESVPEMDNKALQDFMKVKLGDKYKTGLTLENAGYIRLKLNKDDKWKL